LQKSAQNPFKLHYKEMRRHFPGKQGAIKS